MRHLLRYLELHLTLVGLIVTATSAVLASRYANETFYVVAIVATAVGVIHGCLFFAVRHRQRLVRAETIEAIQGMLKDVVNNQLQVIQFADAANRRRPGAVSERTISDSIRRISGAIGTLSDESLSRWRKVLEPDVANENEIEGISLTDPSAPEESGTYATAPEGGAMRRTEGDDRAEQTERSGYQPGAQPLRRDGSR